MTAKELYKDEFALNDDGFQFVTRGKHRKKKNNNNSNYSNDNSNSSNRSNNINSTSFYDGSDNNYQGNNHNHYQGKQHDDNFTDNSNYFTCSSGSSKYTTSTIENIPGGTMTDNSHSNGKKRVIQPETKVFAKYDDNFIPVTFKMFTWSIPVKSCQNVIKTYTVDVVATSLKDARRRFYIQWENKNVTVRDGKDDANFDYNTNIGINNNIMNIRDYIMKEEPTIKYSTSLVTINSK